MLAAVVVAMLIALSATSTLRRVGDGGEYVAMALNFSRLHGPSISLPDLRAIERRFPSLGPSYSGVTLEDPQLRGRDGRQDYTHFWLYPGLAALFAPVTRSIGVHPQVAFTILNILLMGLAAWIVAQVIAAPLAVFVLAGPVIWWVDKAHSEVFTFTTLTIAMCLLEQAPGAAMVALGAASAQNIALAPALAIAAAAALGRRAVRADWRFWCGLACGGALAAFSPAYYWIRLGTWSPLAGTAVGRMPSLTQLTAPLLDLNLGLLMAFPWLGIAVVMGAWVLVRTAPRRLLAPDIVASVACAVAFLLAASQAPNVNSGGTPGISRYGIWFLPLAIPILRRAGDTGRLPRVPTVLLAAVSCLWCIAVFHPAVAENYTRPTHVAAWVWTNVPGADNPLPEVFAERAGTDADATWPPQATSGCEKVLLLGDGRVARGPDRCGRFQPPLECVRRDALCYANRSDGAYTFREAPRQAGYVERMRRTLGR